MTRATPTAAGRPRRPRRLRLALIAVLVAAVLVGVGATLAGVVAPAGGDAQAGPSPAATSTVDMEARIAGIEKRFPDGYPQHSIVLTGSSSFNKWTTSKEDLRPLETFNIGIGGTTVSDHLQYLERMVAPFDPRAVLVYVGANDISGDSDTRTGAETADLVVEYLGALEETAPDARIFYVEIAETPAREAVRDEVRQANLLISEYITTDERVTFVPTSAALLTPEGAIDPTLFVDDGLHFSDAGYDRFSEAIRSVVLPALE